jgi:trk system potassium uptake protein
MYIVIMGGGSVGYYLSKELLEIGHEVLVLDKIPANCERFGDELGNICIRGDGCEVSTLIEAGVGRADVFIATTNEDEDNLVSCQIAKHKFKVPRTIARVNNPKNEDIFKKLGVDTTIGVTNIIMKNIEEQLPSSTLIHLGTFAEAGVETLEFKISSESASSGQKVSTLTLPWDSIFPLLIRKGNKTRVLSKDTILQPDDVLVILATLEKEKELREKLLGR